MERRYCRSLAPAAAQRSRRGGDRRVLKAAEVQLRGQPLQLDCQAVIAAHRLQRRGEAQEAAGPRHRSRQRQIAPQIRQRCPAVCPRLSQAVSQCHPEGGRATSGRKSW